jgi:hypothetical protein
LLGHLASLQVHHIFPKALLYKAGYGRDEVNAVANFCLLTQDSNLVVGKRDPSDYFSECEERHPGVLASQWIPEDPELWRIDRYPDFLTARRRMLARAANDFLGELRSGTAAPISPLPRLAAVVEADVSDGRAQEITHLIKVLTGAGYASPVLDAEIPDPDTGGVLAIAEAFWPDGLQRGQGSPVILELDPLEADRPRLEELGYEIFTSVGALEHHAVRRSEIAAGLRPEE